MILLWDKLAAHNGRPATFFPQGQSQQVAPAASSAKGDAAVPAASTLGTGAAALPVAGAAEAAPKVTHVVSTDVLKLTFDSEGGSLVGADLLQHLAATHSSKNQDVKPLTLLTQTPNHTMWPRPG